LAKSQHRRHTFQISTGFANLNENKSNVAPRGPLVDRWVDFVWNRAVATVALVAVLTVAALGFIATNLSFNLDNKTLLDPDLPFQRASRELERYFPPVADSLLVIVDAETPELCRSATEALVAKLAAEPERYRDVYAPATLPFFARNALLYRSVDDLGELGDRVAEMQPVLAEMAAEPTIANLARLVGLGLERHEELGAAATQWASVLDRIGDATVEIYQEFPVAVSWEELMVAGSGIDAMTRQVIIVEPVLHFRRLLAADEAIGRIRSAASDLGLSPERGVTVRITGNPALNRDEMRDLAEDVGIGSIVSLVLILGILFLAMRSWALVAATLLTLVIGLVWTAAFATLAVGSLNLLSITFGLLFIGLGVDFPIHLGMHYAEAFRRGKAAEPATLQASHEVVGSLVLCALTTALGFLAFVPTDYRGVGELGLISSGGMVVVLVLTLTLFPALLRLFAPAPRSAPWERGVLAPAGLAVRYPKVTVGIAAAAGLVALLALPQLRFESDVISLRNPQTESVQAFRDLLGDAERSPWSVDVLAPDLAAADAIAAKLEEVPVVGSVVTASDYVPEDQEEKQAILADAAFLLDTPPVADRAAVKVPVAEQIAALRKLHEELGSHGLAEAEDSTLRASVVRLRAELARFLERIAGEPDPAPALEDLEDVLLGNFADQLGRLETALEPQEVTLDSLPHEIRSRLIASDGTARVQAFSANKIEGTDSLEAFVDGVRAVAPTATGVAANIVSFARATSDSMIEAMTWATIAIVLLLVALQRRLDDAVLILTPVLLGLTLAAASMVLLGLSFNFANVVVLPLLLGVGVDSGIHLVRRTRAGDSEESLPQTTTGAVFYSALTTIVGFGSLAFSDHLGIASMGILLVNGMVLVLAANLVFLPALLRLVIKPRR
jgi:hopanoid biosynthesis associated RND transporter like protein HpnN